MARAVYVMPRWRSVLQVARRLFVLILLLVGLLPRISAVEGAGRPVSEMSIDEWEANWTQVLARYVDASGRIDFRGLQSDRSTLDRVVDFIARIDPISAPERFPSAASQIAYYINAYNALAMSGVLDAGVPESLGGLRKVWFFYFRTFTIGGRSISLYEFENEIIRPLGEERVHFALNCMVVSCPRLPRRAFLAATLQDDLERAARGFLAEERNVRVDAAKRQIWLSAIFDFYTDDFLAKAPTLAAYVNRYRAKPVPADFKVRFADYDWTVNDRTRICGPHGTGTGDANGCVGSAGHSQ